jgi:hypothetical protein
MNNLALGISGILALIVIIQFWLLRRVQQQLAQLTATVATAAATDQSATKSLATEASVNQSVALATRDFLEKRQFEQEINTVWSEMENLRSELLAQVAQNLTAQNWPQFLATQIPNYEQLCANLTALQQAEPTVAQSLTAHLPAYLQLAALPASLVSYLRTPFERINWLEILILPVEAALQNKANSTLQANFLEVLAALNYELIDPESGETWQPEKHEVIEQHRSELSRGAVLKVLRPGYQYQNQIVRKAQIIISAGR